MNEETTTETTTETDCEHKSNLVCGCGKKHCNHPEATGTTPCDPNYPCPIKKQQEKQNG